MNKYQKAFDFINSGNVTAWGKENYEPFLETKEILKELVNKATPKKPRKETFITGKSAYLCPTCQYALSSGKEYVSPTLRYCECCGQALDWSEENEE